MASDQRSVSGGIRSLLRLEGLCVFIISCLCYRHLGFLWSRFFILFLFPDLSFFGYIAGSRIGAITYNTLHSYVSPTIFAVGAYALGIEIPMAFLLIWLSHIGLDRALGYGLKYSDAFTSTHLGRIEKDRDKV